MTDSRLGHLRMGACTRRIVPASPGVKATGLATERVDHAAWCRPSRKHPSQESII